MNVLYIGLPEILDTLLCIYLDPTSDVVMKSVGSNGSLSSLLMMKLKV